MILISIFLKSNNVGFHVVLSTHLWCYSTSNSGLSPSTSISKQDDAVTLGCARWQQKTTEKKPRWDFYCSLLYYLETRSLRELETVLALLTSQQDPRSNLSLPSVPNARVIRTHSYIWLFTLHGFWGLKSSSHVYTSAHISEQSSQSQEISLGFFF